MRQLLSIAIIWSVCFGADGGTHTVKRNETLATISKLYAGVTVESIVLANNLENKNVIYAGQKLIIPDKTTTVTAPSKYVVRPNDTLAGIAREFKVPVSDLMKVNKIRNPNRIEVGEVIQIPIGSYREVSYTVKRGDNLASIASRYAMTADEVAKYNQISNPNKITQGQKLMIPQLDWSGFNQAQLDATTQRELDRIRISSGKWKYIVIHHTGTPYDTPTSIDKYHRDIRHMENGLAYHFVIGNGVRTEDGEIYVADRWKRQIQGGHLASVKLNEVAIGICLVGDFTSKKPSSKQMESLRLLTQYLLDETGIPKSRVETHKQIHPGHTACPGNFPIKSFLADLE